MPQAPRPPFKGLTVVEEEQDSVPLADFAELQKSHVEVIADRDALLAENVKLLDQIGKLRDTIRAMGSVHR